MIFHVSIPADDPERVAKAMAELLGGTYGVARFWPGGFMARAGDDDENRTIIEVYPRKTPITPGEEQGEPGYEETPARYNCFHVALGTELSKEAVLAIAQREGWRARHVSRYTSFDLIELWVENCLMIETFTPEMQATYRARVGASPYRAPSMLASTGSK